MDFQVSLSAEADFQRCEQRYYYRVVRGLRKKVPDVAPERGSMLHEYLSHYYNGLMNEMSPPMSHEASLLKLERDQRHKLQTLAAVSKLAGDYETAQQFADMWDAIVRIADRYYLVRGQHDASQYTPVLVEERVSVELIPGITSVSVIDLVLRDRDDRLWLVEHKTGASIPNPQVRLLDLQTLLYTATLPLTHGIEVDGILWNYLRTKEPTAPEQLKSGGFSHSKSQDTTWETYHGALAKAGISAESYADMKALLVDRETTRFFPRHENYVVLDRDKLLRDYIKTASRMRTSVLRWEQKVDQPVRTITRDCQWCPYYRLCEADLTGGDDTTLIQQFYTTREDRENGRIDTGD
jgi:RecB family exonuclease